MHQVIEEKVTVETPTLPTPAQMYARCDHMSTIRVAYYLHYVFSCGQDEISFEGRTMTVMEFARGKVNTDPRECIFFWGGPPEAEDWYSGTLVTMLLDRYLYNLSDEDGDPYTSINLLEHLENYD